MTQAIIIEILNCAIMQYNLNLTAIKINTFIHRIITEELLYYFRRLCWIIILGKSKKIFNSNGKISFIKMKLHTLKILLTRLFLKIEINIIWKIYNVTFDFILVFVLKKKCEFCVIFLLVTISFSSELLQTYDIQWMSKFSIFC